MLEAIVHVVLEVACGVTGHFILWAVTFGRWDIANGRNSEATIVGLLFWAAVAGGIWLVFFR